MLLLHNLYHLRGKHTKYSDMSMFGLVGTGFLGDWDDDILVGLSDNVLFNGGDVVNWLLWFGSMIWGIGCNDKFFCKWLLSLTSNSVSISG